MARFVLKNVVLELEIQIQHVHKLLILILETFNQSNIRSFSNEQIQISVKINEKLSFCSKEEIKPWGDLNLFPL